MKSWKILHQQLMYLPTSPVNCSHFTLGNPTNHFSTILFICTSHYLRYLRLKRTVTVIVNVPITPEKCNRTALWNAEVIRLMEDILFSSKRWWLWKVELRRVALLTVIRAGCVLWQLECQASSVTTVFKVNTVCIDTRFQFLCHWLIAWSTKLCWNSVHVSTSRFRNSCVSRIGTWCTRFCIMPQMQ